MEARQRASAALVILLVAKKRRRRRRPRSCWVREWVKRRDELGACNNLIAELVMEDPHQYRNFTRMTAREMEEVLTIIGPHITKQDTVMRRSISAKDRLLVKLRFLASGDSYSSLQYLFRIPKCTIGKIVKEVCWTLYAEMKHIYLKFPETTQEWRTVSDQYQMLWQFPHCIGAIDGKHITIQAPQGCGSYYYNYKNTHSIVLLAVVDAKYKFMYIDVGCNGRVSDGGVFTNSSLYEALETNSLPLPPQEPLTGRQKKVPFYLVGDDAFALSKFLMKPYPFRGMTLGERVYNYRISRARRVVENSFGILASRFRVLQKPMLLQPNVAEVVTLAVCTLHNFLISKRNSQYMYTGAVDVEDDEGNLIPGDWRKESQPTSTWHPLQRKPKKGTMSVHSSIRDELQMYVMSPAGQVSWQYDKII